MPDQTESLVVARHAVTTSSTHSLFADDARAAALREASRDWLSWDLTHGQLADLELLLNGFFAPLDGFMTQADYDGVVRDMRLANGPLWPLPVVLAVPAALAGMLTTGAMLALRDPEGVMLAALHVDEIWAAEQPAGESSAAACVGGRVEGLVAPVHHDFAALRLTASQVRDEIARRGWTRTIALAPETLLHRAEVEAARHLMRTHDAGLVVHVADGARGDVHHYARVRCFRLAIARLVPGRALLVLTPPIGAPQDARTALALALMHKHVGCTHVLLPPGGGLGGRDRLLAVRAAELGLELIPFPQSAYVADGDHDSPIPGTSRPPALAESDLKQLLADGGEIPTWFTYPEIATQLRLSYPPRREQGLTIFFTGLSGSGKSTLANALLDVLLERGGRAITLLDGDLARRHLSSELGFSRAHRTLNVRRIGYVAAEITRSGGVAICALIAPHAAIRDEVRQMIEAVGGFVLVHVATTLEVCEARDRKGLYAKARAGLLTEFTGISDPYDVPHDAEVTINAATQSVSEAAQVVLRYLETAGYLDPSLPHGG